jgi:hypothetical protein
LSNESGTGEVTEKERLGAVGNIRRETRKGTA